MRSQTTHSHKHIFWVYKLLERRREKGVGLKPAVLKLRVSTWGVQLNIKPTLAGKPGLWCHKPQALPGKARPKIVRGFEAIQWNLSFVHFCLSAQPHHISLDPRNFSLPHSLDVAHLIKRLLSVLMRISWWSSRDSFTKVARERKKLVVRSP